MKKNIECYMCGGKNVREHLNFTYIRHHNQIKCDKSVMMCDDCGFLFLYIEDKKELNDLYERYFRCYGTLDFENEKYVIPVRKEIKKYCHKKNRILEVGTGFGNVNLKYLRSKGYHNSIGIDLDPDVCDNEIVLNHSVEEFDKINKEKYDIIFSFHTLEHLVDPMKMLNFIYNNLKENGKAIIEIPNSDDPLLSLYKNEAYNKFYWYLFHNYFFNYKSIKCLLGKTQLKYKINLKQRYGIINHMRWFFLNRPGNINFHIPIIDDIYKLIIKKLFKVSDTLFIILEK